MNDAVLVTGLAGDYIFLTPSDFDKFVNHKLTLSDNIYMDLKSKQLLADSNEELHRNVNMTSTRYRTRKGFLRSRTKYITSLKSMQQIIIYQTIGCYFLSPSGTYKSTSNQRVNIQALKASALIHSGNTTLLIYITTLIMTSDQYNRHYNIHH